MTYARMHVVRNFVELIFFLKIGAYEDARDIKMGTRSRKLRVQSSNQVEVHTLKASQEPFF